MAISIKSCGYIGVKSYVVNVEVDISNGLPIFNIVGMGDLAILESKERVRNSFKNIGIDFPIKRILVNLSPADIKKKGSNYDLPICVGLFCNIDIISQKNKIDDYIIVGEISLNGEVKACNGAISAAILAKEKKMKGIIIPYDNMREVSLIEGIEIVAVKHLKDVILFFEQGTKPDISNEIIEYKSIENEKEELDFSDVKGQMLAKRALEIAAAGGHHMLMIGDPGSGKSMLSKRFTTILPSMSETEIIETTKIYSISGMLSKTKPIINERPFRSPHHNTTETAMIGGANRVGEITLALNGVLFLDELAEFSSKTLESLRQPLEDGEITISRANMIVTYPVKMILVAASNPTPSGYFSDSEYCKDSLIDIRRYQKKFSGPLLDRIDLYIEMKRLEKEEMFNCKISESSIVIKNRVEKARNIQFKRFKTSMKLNVNMTRKDIEKYCIIDDETKKIFELAIEELKLSARVYDKILKISRTIADLENSEDIKSYHLLEALNYRKKY